MNVEGADMECATTTGAVGVGTVILGAVETTIEEGANGLAHLGNGVSSPETWTHMFHEEAAGEERITEGGHPRLR